MIKFFLTLVFSITMSFSSTRANLAYITNEKDNTVSVIDIKKKKVIDTVKAVSYTHLTLPTSG